MMGRRKQKGFDGEGLEDGIDDIMDFQWAHLGLAGAGRASEICCVRGK